MHDTKTAHSAGQAAATNESAAVGSSGRVGAEHGKADSSNFASDGAKRKAFASMTAQAALCGCTLHELPDGGYLLCRWGMSRELPCLRAVGDLLRRIGGQHG